MDEVGSPVHLSATLVFSLSIYDFFPTAISRLYWYSYDKLAVSTLHLVLSSLTRANPPKSNTALVSVIAVRVFNCI